MPALLCSDVDAYAFDLRGWFVVQEFFSHICVLCTIFALFCGCGFRVQLVRVLGQYLA